MPDIYRPYVTFPLAKVLNELSVIRTKENEFITYHLNKPLGKSPSLQGAFPIIEAHLSRLLNLYLACGDDMIFKLKEFDK